MGKPRLIILVRHGQSEGNKNRAIHQTVPDHRVKLTEVGMQQARDAGKKLLDMLSPTDTVQFYTSPYVRTRSTTEGMLSSLKSHPNYGKIKVYEEPRLREQDFGNFQPCSAEMTRMWHERAAYGHFFYRIPNGESAADAYDRIAGFNETLFRQFEDPDFPSVLVLVTHGLMTRIFLMKWYHYSVEYFEDLRNINHCEFVIMKKDNKNKYILQNKLRTWSAYQAEQRKLRAAAAAEEGDKNEATDAVDVSGVKDDKKAAAAAEALGHSSTQDQSYGPPPFPGIKYGGCPHGCNHGQNFRFGNGITSSASSPNLSAKGRTEKKHPHSLLSVGRDGGGTLSGDGSEDDADAEKSGNETENTKRERRERIDLQAAEAKRDCEGLSDDDDPAARLNGKL